MKSSRKKREKSNDPEIADETMLSRDQAVSEYDFRSRRVIPDRLTRKANAAYLEHARRMIRIYQRGHGQTRQRLHQLIEKTLSREPDCPARRIAAFCKLLDDRSVYEQGGSGDAERLRKTVFRRAASFHPLVTHTEGLFDNDREAVRKKICEELEMDWSKIEHRLFADVIDLHRLKDYQGPTEPAALLARYNVAQTQVALFDAIHVTVWAMSDLQTIVRGSKLAGLMHTIVRESNGNYCFRFDGPASVLRDTKRYGTSIAKFLPSLISCCDWKLHARLKPKSQLPELDLVLTSSDGLTSDVQPGSKFDSSVELDFYEKWGIGRRQGWQLLRDAALRVDRQHVFTPDFVLRDEVGQEIDVEIIGYWTNQYLEKKIDVISRQSDKPMILIVQSSNKNRFDNLNLAENCRVIPYRESIRVNLVLDAVEQIKTAIWK